MTLGEVWRTEESAVRRGFRVIVFALTGQQLSGINAVMYYSTDIMSSVLDLGSAKYISLFITLVNLLMTFPPIFLIDRVGRKSLVLISIFFMTACSFILAISITENQGILSSIAIVGFVAAFSIGLGPIPFVIMGEIVPSYATSATGSVALASNWTTNFLVGLLFLPIRDALKGSNGEGEGRVFYIFVGTGVFLFIGLLRLWR
ncbi:general substrate transporter [Atractiella rhizophila]|nr:general substrate transporter [Atractiella rhizophila]